MHAQTLAKRKSIVASRGIHGILPRARVVEQRAQFAYDAPPLWKRDARRLLEGVAISNAPLVHTHPAVVPRGIRFPGGLMGHAGGSGGMGGAPRTHQNFKSAAKLAIAPTSPGAAASDADSCSRTRCIPGPIPQDLQDSVSELGMRLVARRRLHATSSSSRMDARRLATT